MIKIYSWNVNGIRAARKKGFLDWLRETSPDILGVQETKAMPEQLDEEILKPKGYHTFWNSAERKGYSGVALFTKKEPLSIIKGFGIKRFDAEGRSILAEYSKFYFYNIYFPNGQRDEVRLRYKLDFYDAMLKHAARRKKKKPVIITGDFNTAHTEIDLARPKQNETISGFLPEEREWVQRYLDSGYIDVFRRQNPDLKDQYSWWSYRANARANNVGWRIDYFLVSDQGMKLSGPAEIHSDIMGSDHCPISLSLKKTAQ